MDGSRYICYPKLPSWYRPGMRFPAPKDVRHWSSEETELSSGRTAPRGSLKGPTRSRPIPKKGEET